MASRFEPGRSGPYFGDLIITLKVGAILLAAICILGTLAGCETMPVFECEVADPNTCAILAKLHQIEWNTQQAADAAAYSMIQQMSRPVPLPVAPPVPVMQPVWEWKP